MFSWTKRDVFLSASSYLRSVVNTQFVLSNFNLQIFSKLEQLQFIVKRLKKIKRYIKALIPKFEVKNYSLSISSSKKSRC